MPISRGGGGYGPAALASASGDFFTTFSGTEDPISEGGIWIGGQTNGLRWNNAKTAGGDAFGAAVVTGYDDCLAHLSTAYRTFAANQFAEGVVSRAGGYGTTGSSHEIELLLRFGISNAVASDSIAGTAAGYEVLWGRGGELNCVRWDGYLGGFTPVGSPTGPDIGAAVDGDVLRAEISGNIITVKLNGSTVQTWDITTPGGTVYSSGQPGLGFWPTNSSTPSATPSSYCWHSYRAGDL